MGQARSPVHRPVEPRARREDPRTDGAGRAAGPRRFLTRPELRRLRSRAARPARFRVRGCIRAFRGGQELGLFATEVLSMTRVTGLWVHVDSPLVRALLARRPGAQISGATVGPLAPAARGNASDREELGRAVANESGGGGVCAAEPWPRTRLLGAASARSVAETSSDCRSIGRPYESAWRRARRGGARMRSVGILRVRCCSPPAIGQSYPPPNWSTPALGVFVSMEDSALSASRPRFEAYQVPPSIVL